MTFSGEMMMALMIIAAVVFFSRDRRGTGWLLAAGALVSAGLLAAFTRSMWLGAACGGAYLIWVWRRWLVLAIPVAAGLLLLANPFKIGERAISAFHPHGDLDSNEHRAVLRRVGWQMIKAHPWVGVGPEEVGPQFQQYIPADVPRPLPTGYYGHLHNVYYHYAAERGIPTMLALMWMLGQALFDFARRVRRLTPDAEERWVLHAAIGVMIAVLISGFYELNLGDSEVLGMFLAVVGCGYVAIAQGDQACEV
jgi:putative inorganic carbon (HCO3(-)) transporter